MNIDDIKQAPLDRSRALLLSGTALSRGACRDATLYAAERAHTAGATVFLDLDLRPDQWAQQGAFAVNLRALLPFTQVLIGTEENSTRGWRPTQRSSLPAAGSAPPSATNSPYSWGGCWKQTAVPSRRWSSSAAAAGPVCWCGRRRR
ncbi:MAG: hypothetical protein IPK16_29020 [Anaerolineales bacterium]|nr:hypothetical protein [Anaerolineales bacterium]